MIKFGNTYLTPETGVIIVIAKAVVTVQNLGEGRNFIRPTLNQKIALEEYFNSISVDVEVWKKQRDEHPVLTLQVPERAKPTRKAKL